MNKNDDSFNHEDDGEKVEAYSHYRTVSESVFKDVNKAVDAYSYVNSRRSQNMGMTPQSLSNAKRAMLKVCKQLGFQIKMSRRGDEELQEIHDRWYDQDEGYINKLDNATLSETDLSWLSQMVDDLVEAAWRLGYTQSGRMQTVHKTDEQEADAEVREMFS